MARNQKNDEDIKVVCRNRRAFHDYTVEDTLECGLVLTGTEVKSLRERSCSLEDAYAKIEGGEVWLIGSDIPEYSMANRLNHKPKRKRKLLMHRREIERLIGKTAERGLTLVPTRIYFKGPRAKIEIAVARGKPQVDKRRDLKAKDQRREIERALAERR